MIIQNTFLDILARVSKPVISSSYFFFFGFVSFVLWVLITVLITVQLLSLISNNNYATLRFQARVNVPMTKGWIYILYGIVFHCLFKWNSLLSSIFSFYKAAGIFRYVMSKIFFSCSHAKHLYCSFFSISCRMKVKLLIYLF